MVCWDNECNNLAGLSCGHHACKDCLQAMGERSQTACPLCRKALFSPFDYVNFMASKGSLTLAAINAGIIVLVLVRELRRPHYDWFDLIFGLSQLGAICFPNWLVLKGVRSGGVNWWRQSPDYATNIERRLLYFNFGSGLLLLPMLFYKHDGGFN